MSIAQSLLEIIGEAARKNDLGKVTVVRMRIGRMSAVVPEALEFCFEVMARGTPAEGAKLEVAVVPLSGECLACGRSFALEDLRFDCPECGSPSVRLTGGEELHLDELEGE